MDKQFPAFAPLGRLYDPLQQLAERVHRALLIKEKTVWTDNNGYVFATPTDSLRTITPHATIGVYAKWTPLQLIETGLRTALRERASAWIVDWKTQPLSMRADESHTPRFAPMRKRRRKPTDGATRAMLPNVHIPQPGQLQSRL